MLFSGINDSNLKTLENLFDTSIIIRDNELKVILDGDSFERFIEVVNNLFSIVKEGEVITEDIILKNYEAVLNGSSDDYLNCTKRIIAYNHANKAIRVKTVGQHRLIESIKEKDITFASGPAGTGKTYLAVVMAVNALKNNEVKKIVLTRPAVEAGESLGFLPGDLKEKVDPYLMPLYDALDELLGHEKVETLMERNVIEIIPLAYMRGRTLNDAFVILDEAQNTTSTQMKMFLTRLGLHSKMVITGDITQIDINIKKTSSGFKEACDILYDINGIGIVNLDKRDVVRNPLVSTIIDSYERRL
ncbi:MAG: PhoH family protein [Erysipelotrichaceae bacterium]